MIDRISIVEAEYYNAIHNLCADLLQESKNSEAHRLGKWLELHLKKIRGPLTLQREITLCMAEIRKNEATLQEITDHNRFAEYVRSVKSLSNSLGSGEAIRPGPLLICPVSGCSYSQYLMQKGEDYPCKIHADQMLIQKPVRRRRK